jgi:hydroxymethylbilane synthase
VKPLRIGTRRSELAIIQATLVAEHLAATARVAYELVPLVSLGDRRPDMPLSQFPGQGVFVKELQRALQHGRIDIAVHSLKDLPLVEPHGLTVAAVCLRHTPTDTLLCHQFCHGLDGLPRGAKVGTGSPRRRAQLKLLRPDLQIEPIRGNVTTRVNRLQHGEVDAIVVASAAMARLGLSVNHAVELSIEDMLPAPGQGALAVEVRESDHNVISLVSAIDEPETRMCTDIERQFLRAVGGGCHVSAAAYCRPGPNDTYVLDAGVEVQGRFRRTRVTFGPDRALWAAQEAACNLLGTTGGEQAE